MMRKAFLLGIAALLSVRLVTHLEEPFLHNPIDLFLDAFVGFSIVLLVANAFGFQAVSWSRTIAPCLAALVVIMLMPRTIATPGFRMAKWAEQSPWDGYQPPIFFIDVDPWLALSADLLVFTTVFSLLLVLYGILRSSRGRYAKAA